MSKKKGEIDFKAIVPFTRKITKSALRYVGILFCLLVAAVYGFVLFRINVLGSAQPTDSDISAQTKSTVIPKVDPIVIEQIQALKDNSGNVKTLFEQSRDNPFQENK